MAKFALEKMDIVVGAQRFDKFVVDGIAPIDKFEADLEAAYESEMDAIYAYMNLVANNTPLPGTKYHALDNESPYRAYEFKSKHLRVYALAQPGGKIIVMGGYKTDQPKDIIKLNSLRKQYVESLKAKKK